MRVTIIILWEMEKFMKKKTKLFMAGVCCTLLLSACGDKQGGKPSETIVETMEAETEEAVCFETIEEDTTAEETYEATAEETTMEIPTEKDGLLEINAQETNLIPLEVLIAPVSVEKILHGKPVLYARYRVDDWIFEWFLSDYEYEDNYLLQDAVLVISKENDANNYTVIPVKGEASGGTWVDMVERFKYIDVNFDQKPDLLVNSGYHGNQGLIQYYCFLQTADGFVEEPSFTKIANPCLDIDNKLILSYWRNSAVSHGWAEYEYTDGKYVVKRTLTEDIDYAKTDDKGENIYIWDIDGKVIGRSDELTEEEIADLLYNENSDWGIGTERWTDIVDLL